MCVTETASDPKEIRYNDVQIYPVGLSLEQAVALVWKPKQFNIETSYTLGVDCGASCSYQTGTINGTSDDSNEHAKLTKMSDLVCLESYYPEYTRIGQSNSYTDCNGDPQSPYEISSFLQININDNPLIPFNFPIYLYNPTGIIQDDLYYINMFFSAGNGTGNLNDYNKTTTAGIFTIQLGDLEDITFPIYFSEATGSCGQPTASATFSMTKTPYEIDEREKN